MQIPRILDRLSLRWKLAGLVAVILGIVSVFLLVFFPARMEALSRQGVERRALDIASLVSTLVAPAVDFDKPDEVVQTLCGLTKATDLTYAAVRLSDGKLFAACGRDASGALAKTKDAPALPEAALTHEPRVLATHDGQIHVASPVVGAGGGGGVLLMGFSLGRLEADRRDILRTVAEVAIGVFLFGIALSFWTGTQLIRPAILLTEITARIVRDGDLTQRIDITSQDEIGQLAASFREMVEKLRAIPTTLKGSVVDLSSSVNDIMKLTRDQTGVVQKQAASLAEASATTQEIKQTSSLASTKAETVLQIATKAEAFSGAGQLAVEGSIQGLQDIRAQIEAIVGKIADLSESTLQVGEIIESVKDIADQSNVLALNASIEAAKAGEFGKGFAVVAREIRSLADQSIQSTGRIREILSEIQAAIRSTVSITEEGKRRMESSMEQIRASGENLREMTEIVKDSSQAARQIAASVNQQNAGITQISSSIVGLNEAMEQTVVGIRSAEGAAENLRAISGRIAGIVEAFRV